MSSYLNFLYSNNEILIRVAHLLTIGEGIEECKNPAQKAAYTRIRKV